MTRFTSRAAPGALLSRVEDAAHALGGRTRRRDDTRHVPAPIVPAHLRRYPCSSLE